MLAVDPRLAELGVRAILPAAAVEGFLAAHRLATAPAEAYDRHRLALGVPDGSADLVPQKASCSRPTSRSCTASASTRAASSARS